MDQCQYPRCVTGGAVEKCKNADHRLVCDAHSVWSDGGIVCFMCYQDRARAALKWPAFWPEHPTGADQGSALARHAETVDWWKEVLRSRQWVISVCLSWSAAEMDRLVMFADVMSVAGKMRFVEEFVAAAASELVIQADFYWQWQLLSERLMKSPPRVRALVLFGNRAEPGEALEDPTTALRMVLSKAVGKRLGLRDAVWTSDWVPAALNLRAAKACHLVDLAAEDVGEAIAKCEHALANSAHGSSCAPALLVVILVMGLLGLSAVEITSAWQRL